MCRDQNKNLQIIGNNISFMSVGNSVFSQEEHDKSTVKMSFNTRVKEYSNLLFWLNGQTYFFHKSKYNF